MSNKRKHKHLDLIQSVINRLAANSFQVKAWAVALITGTSIFLASVDSSAGILLLFLPTIAFWVLDGYFLHQERLFRGVYDHVRCLDESAIDYSMSTAPDNSTNSPNSRSCWGWCSAVFSKTLILFYGALAVLIVTACLLAAAEVV